jgi:hypothetical protein
MAYTQNKAIMFAEWLSKNEWIKRKEGQTHPNKVGKYYSHIQCEYKPIEELYDLFEASAEKNIIKRSEPHLPLSDISGQVCRCVEPLVAPNEFPKRCSKCNLLANF